MGVEATRRGRRRQIRPSKAPAIAAFFSSLAHTKTVRQRYEHGASAQPTMTLEMLPRLNRPAL